MAGLGSFSHAVLVSSIGALEGFASPKGFEAAPALANGEAPALGAASANGEAALATGLVGASAPKGEPPGGAAGAAAPNGLAGFAGAAAPKGEAALAAAGLGFAGASSAEAGISKGLVASPLDPIPATDLFVSNGSWNGSVFLPVTLPSPNELGNGLGDRFFV